MTIVGIQKLVAMEERTNKRPKILAIIYKRKLLYKINYIGSISLGEYKVFHNTNDIEPPSGDSRFRFNLCVGF